MTQFPAVIELSSLDGSNGFQINGEAWGEAGPGFSVSSAGDINADGFADLIIGAPAAGPNGSNSGASYVVLGKASGFPANLELSSLDGSNGFQINGEAAYDGSGFSVSSAGDVNGDGFADLIIGASWGGWNGSAHGAAYVVLGKASDFPANLELSSLDGSNGFQINGEMSVDQSGTSVSSAGDINGDGFADLFVSTSRTSVHGGYFYYSGERYDNFSYSSSNAAYVVYGQASAFGANLELSNLDGANGFRINGGVLSGINVVSSAGDVNGDGLADLIIGTSGASDVVFGNASGFGANLELSSLDGSNGFQINGSGSGRPVSSAGDINGDGFADVIIGGRDGPNGLASGASYVVFGKASGFGANLELSSLDGSNGFQINGEAAYDFSGWSVSSAGDINGDGFDDLIIGAPQADPNGLDSGASYVVLGKASGFPAHLELSSLDGSNGFKINGEVARDVSGRSVSSAGDINGDGFADLIISADRLGPFVPYQNGSESNAAYILFGHATGQTVQTMTAADFNNDLKADLLWQNDNGPVSIWTMDGLTSLAGSLVGHDPGPSWHVKRAGDFNGDGKADILWQHDNGQASIWLMDGFTPLGGSLVGNNNDPAWQVKDTGDFNSDGKADILWQNADGRASIWLMDGLTPLGGGLVGSNYDPAWKVKGSGDFNGDGKSDILWQHDSGPVSIWLMDGLTPLGGSVVGPNPGTSWHIRGTGDFNADGKSDILWQHDDGQASIWLMDGFTPLGGSLVGNNTDPAWQVKGTGDFNGDGNADIVWQNTDGTPTVWLMNGISPLSGLSFSNPGSDWHVIAMGS